MTVDSQQPGPTWSRAHAHAVMPRAFDAFLSRFPSLTAIQAEAMPLLFQGQDAVVVAPAAAGKTEAVVAPLCERLLRDRPKKGAGIAYIVPTRALANDLESRLQSPVESLGLVLTVRTGDRPAALAKGVDILMTTPESLDSLLCRQPELFEGLRALVLDEAHLLEGSYRGDQARVLVRRLRKWHVKQPFQAIAMTATSADPAALGAWLLGGHPVVARAGLERPVRTEMVDTLRDATTDMRKAGLTKALIFCNSRRRVEEVAAELARNSPWPPERVMAHHASLSRREREDVERAFRRWEAGLLVSTTTMETGVDIGDVDAVLLVGAPETLSSFYQRVGRGCRRRSGLLAYCIPDAEGDRAAFAAIIEALSSDNAHPVDPVPDLSVAVQQTFSILYGRPRGATRRELSTVLKVLAEPPILEQIWAHLAEQGWIESAHGDRWVATTELMDLGEKGRVHSNIPDSHTVKVVDGATGRVIGQVSAAAAESGNVVLGGRTWRVTHSGRDQASVAPSGASADGLARFGRHQAGGAFARYLPDELRGR